jgi:hypothetical protein
MNARQIARSIGLRTPVFGRVIRERAQFAAERDAAMAERDAIGNELHEFRLQVNHERVHATQGGAVLWVQPGHFYSPIPAIDEIRQRHQQIFQRDRELPGIDLRIDEQRSLLRTLSQYVDDIPFPADRSDDFRYFFQNPAYSWGDGIVYHCMLRHLRPRRIIEVGSGYSSALALDTNERFLDSRAEITFIEPYPELLRSLLRDGDRCEIVEHAVQDLPLSTFDRLESGDILFIDSTHVMRAGGDVNYLYLEVLPRLPAGVHVHIHDIFDGFEYPEPWIYEGRGWNELYLLRAMLIGNPHLEIQLMNTLMERIDREWFAEHMPDCLRNHGGSIWLRTA